MHGFDATSGLSDTLVILGAAGIVIPLFARFRISPVIGFIIVGIIVGPSGLGALAAQYPWLSYITISDVDRIAPFAEFGIILLLFSIGLELSFKRLWAMRRQVFGVGAAELLGCGALIALILYSFGLSQQGAIGLGLALALSSTALVLPMVGTKSPVGRSAFAMLLFEDLAIVPIIFALGAMAPYSAQEGWDGIFQTLVQGGITVVILFVAGRLILPRLFAQAARTKTPELFLAASLLVVIVASLATGGAGLSPIVGALLAGLLIAETEYHGEVETMTAPFKGLALGVFLLTVGMSLDIAVIVKQWPQLLIGVVGVVMVKAIVTGLLLRLSGAGRGLSAEVGLLMASPSETTLIVLSSALAAGIISSQTAQFWQIVTAIGLTITPLLARLGNNAARRIDRKTSELATMIDEEAVEPRTIILGFGRVGRVVADMLDRHGKPYLAVEANIDAVAAARNRGYKVVFGNTARVEMLDRLHLDNAAAVVMTMNDPVQQVRSTKQIRERWPNLPIVSRARDADHAASLYKAGATDAVPETLESSLLLSEALLVDLGVAMGPVIASIHERRAEMREEIMAKGEMEAEPRLRRVKMPEPQKAASKDEPAPEGASQSGEGAGLPPVSPGPAA